MDLGAYFNIGLLREYAESCYGFIPRLRGIRLMRAEQPSNERGEQMELFDSMCGKDVVYIHTRCGSDNYSECGGDEFESRNADALIAAIDDEFDYTYRDHYFKAVVNDEYKSLLAELASRPKAVDE